MIRFRNKPETGHVLVTLSLMIVGLVSVVGLAVDMSYLSVNYARLRRAADSATLAASGEFKKGASPADLYSAAVRFLNSNGLTGWTSITVENCYFKFDGTLETAYPANGSGDPALCTNPPRRLLRVTVSQDEPTFFLAALGVRTLPMSAATVSEAATRDVVLVLDKSESMGQYNPDYTIKPPFSRDPQACNPDSCHPFQEVKAAASDFVSTYLDPAYDRAAIVTFAQVPRVERIAGATGFSGSVPDILAAINALTVYAGGDDVAGSVPGTCDSAYYGGYTLAHLDHAIYGIPYPCRIYSWSNDYVDPWPGIAGGTRGTFWGFDCPSATAAAYQAPPVPDDYSMCQTSNTGGGLRAAASIFAGLSGPAPRPDALWVTILLTDGLANSSSNGDVTPAHPNGVPYCAGTSSNGPEKTYAPICRDTNALIRHCLTAASADYACPNEANPAQYPGLEVAGSTNVVDALNYDADDYARDMADMLHDVTHSQIFVIGLGSSNPAVYNEITATVAKDGHTVLADPGTPSPGATLLNYIAAKGGTGSYYPSDLAGLPNVFLAIANRITAPPAVQTFTADTLAYSLNVPITAFSATNTVTVTAYMITESATAPAVDDAGWSASVPATYTVLTNGTHTLYPWVKDRWGNVSAEFASPATVFVITTVTLTPTKTSTYTPTKTSTPTQTSTITPTGPTRTSTRTPTPSKTFTPTVTFTKTPTITPTTHMAAIVVSLAGTPAGSYSAPPQGSIRQSYAGLNNGPVNINSPSSDNLIAAERVIYSVNGTQTSFSELMGLPVGQLTDTYWLPWYNNVDLDTQLRFGNVGSSSTAVTITVGSTDYGPYTLIANQSTRISLPGVNNGPVRIHSTGSVPITVAERVIYAVNGTNTSFSEVMGLPNSQLNTTYWMPWYNNVDLDTQLRFGNVSGSTAHVHVLIGGTEMPGSPFTLLTGQSTRVSFAGINNGPVKIESDVPVVAAERVIYAVNGTNTSFSELMGLSVGQLTDTYQFPWYNNVDLDTQLRFGNVGTSSTDVTITVGSTDYGPYTLGARQSTRVSLPGVNNGPVRIHSTGGVSIIAAERVIYTVNGLATSFSEMMGLPDSLLTTQYLFPWYNNGDLDTQLRFGVP